MKISDIINQLRSVLPKYTDYFSTVLSVSSITASGGNATIITSSPHGMVTGANIVLKDVETETAIDSVSQNGLIFTFTTSSDHDLTLNWPEHEYVNLRGFTDSSWNDAFKLVSVTNRRTFSVRSTNTLPTLNGNEYLLEVRVDGVNGRYSATVINDTELLVTGTFNDGNYQGGNVSTAQRISGAVTFERALEQYTEQNLNDLWMFVVMSDASISKDRSTYSDATATRPAGNDMRLRMIDGFSLIIIKNTTLDITAIDAIDICRHDLLLPILKSVNGITFDTGLTYDGDFRSIFLGHNSYDYNKAYLVYQYSFEVAMDLTNSDTVQPEDTRAFRDVDYYLTLGGEDVQQMTVLPIDLDEVPL